MNKNSSQNSKQTHLVPASYFHILNNLTDKLIYIFLPSLHGHFTFSIKPTFIELVSIEKEPDEKSEFGFIDGNLKSIHFSAYLSFLGWYDGS